MTNISDAAYHEVELAQGTIRYRDISAGGTSDRGGVLVFVHGALVNGELWRKVTPLLSPHYRCIVPDLPLGSHSLAMAKDADLSPPGLARLLDEFLAALDLRDVTLIGNDSGGALCQLLVTRHPERVARLVLTNCDAFDNFPPKLFVPLAWGAHLPGFLFVLAQLLRFSLVRHSPLAFGWLSKRRLEKAVLDGYLKPATTSAAIRRDLAKVLTGIAPRYTEEAARRLAAFTRPTLLAWADEDRFFPFAHAERLRQILPNAELERIADSLTFVPEDQPERLAQLVDSFVKRAKEKSEVWSLESGAWR